MIKEEFDLYLGMILRNIVQILFIIAFFALMFGAALFVVLSFIVVYVGLLNGLIFHPVAWAIILSSASVLGTYGVIKMIKEHFRLTNN